MSSKEIPWLGLFSGDTDDLLAKYFSFLMRKLRPREVKCLVQTQGNLVPLPIRILVDDFNYAFSCLWQIVALILDSKDVFGQ